MKQNNTLEVGEDYTENSEMGSGASVEDFIRELEEKERDLHITAELEIEVSESDIDDSNLPDFVAEEPQPDDKPPNKLETHVNVAAHDKLKREISDLETIIARFKAEREEILERHRRQSEDFENFRNRTERERNDRLSIQMKNLATKMLPVLDNLNRAMDFALAMSPEKRAEIEQFVDGIALVHRQVDDVLATMGVKTIKAVGEAFDPRYHEAVATENSSDLPPNTVSEEMLRGYQMGSLVIRHSMVKVTAPDEEQTAITKDDLDQVEDRALTN
jgi:molecular chaperone GrpE